MIDFHAHIDLYSDCQKVIAEITERKMFVLSVTTTPSAWQVTSDLANGSKRIRTALGLHPQIAHLRHSELSLFDELIDKTDYVGEIGLDGGPEFKKYWDIQVNCFKHILCTCSHKPGKVFSIHSRKAATHVLDILENTPHNGIPVLHWFSGTQRELQRAIAAGCWFSVGPAMLLSKKSIELVQHIPQCKIITETDGPFAQLNNKPAMPWDVSVAISQLSKIWNMPIREVESSITKNFKDLMAQRDRLKASTGKCL